VSDSVALQWSEIRGEWTLEERVSSGAVTDTYHLIYASYSHIQVNCP